MERASFLTLMYNAWNAKRPQYSRKNARLDAAANADDYTIVFNLGHTNVAAEKSPTHRCRLNLGLL